MLDCLGAFGQVIPPPVVEKRLHQILDLQLQSAVIPSRDPVSLENLETAAKAKASRIALESQWSDVKSYQGTVPISLTCVPKQTTNGLRCLSFEQQQNDRLLLSMEEDIRSFFKSAEGKFRNQ